MSECACNNCVCGKSEVREPTQRDLEDLTEDMRIAQLTDERLAALETDDSA